MTQGQETGNNVFTADVVKEVLSEVLRLAELPYWLVGEERSAKGDIVHFDLRVSAKELEKIQRRHRGNGPSQGVPTGDDGLAVGDGGAMDNVSSPGSLP